MKIYKPSVPLRPYVRYYWVLESREAFSVLTFPIGCPQLIFHRGSPLYIPELDCHQSAFTVSGQVNFPAHIQSAGGLEMVVAVFYPHTICMFTGVSPSNFYNCEVSGHDFEDRQLDDLAARVSNCETTEGCIHLIDSFLQSKINPTLNIARIGGAVREMLASPAVSVTALADGACLGKRQFERVFREQVGMNPKEYARIVRFQKSMWLMQSGICDYAGIACECGYSDQSHFIREFKAMSGSTPKQLKNSGIIYSDLFTNPA